MVLLPTFVLEVRMMGVDRVQPLHRLLGTFALVVGHPAKLVVVELGHLKRAMRHVWRVEHHQGGLCMVVLFNDIHQLSLVEELRIVSVVERRCPLVRVPKVDLRPQPSGSSDMRRGVQAGRTDICRSAVEEAGRGGAGRQTGSSQWFGRSHNMSACSPATRSRSGLARISTPAPSVWLGSRAVSSHLVGEVIKAGIVAPSMGGVGRRYHASVPFPCHGRGVTGSL